MRPQKLTIQAFGPFAGKEEIDFSLLGSYPLFLINGQTGAGKSSILDAICFALYGQTTGKDRDATQMRCDHAQPDLLTEITLEFSLGSTSYKVSRTPTQQKPKARGEGTTKHQTEAKLWKLTNGEEELLIPKSASESTKHIEELTGLNAEQFRQVMVLPQGKFREFLMADSHQREEIFSKLFQTQIYKKVEFALKDQASGIKKAVTNLQNQVKGILQGADLNNEEDIESELKELTPNLKIKSDQKDIAAESLMKVEREIAAANAILSLFEQLDKDKVHLFELEEKKPEIEEKKELLDLGRKAKSINHINESLKTLQKSRNSQEQDLVIEKQLLTKAEESLEQAEKLKSNALNESKKIDNLKEREIELNNLLPLVDKLKSAKKNKAILEEEYSISSKSLEDSSAKYEKTKSDVLQLESSLDKIRNELVSLPEKKVQLENIVNLGQQKKKIDDLERDLAEENIKLNKFEEEQKLALNEFENKVLAIKELELSWHNAQAAILAKELKKDEECPVCGSCEHPKPATLSNELVSVNKDAIDCEKEKLSNLQSRLNEKNISLAEIKSRISAVKKNIAELKSSLGERENISTKELRAQWSELDSEIKSLSIKKNTAEDGQTKLRLLREEISGLDKSLVTIRSNESEKKRLLIIADQEEKAFTENLPVEFRNIEVLQNEVSKVTGEISRINKLLENSEKEFSEARRILAEVSTRIEEKTKQLVLLNSDINSQESKWSEALNLNSFNNEEDYLKHLVNDSAIRLLESEIESYSKEVNGLVISLKKIEKQLENKERPDIVKLEEKRIQDKENFDILNLKWKELDNRFQQLEDVRTKLIKAHKDNEELNNEYKILGTLSEVANGQTGNKISLQRFVLSVLLDDVLVEASLRLQKMSKGRYSLIRKEDRAKGNKASGLELEVEDSYTGKSRSVATLSGGESFMSALSLALGLSDVVQAYAGGIKLDTLFIDEGFGSLDQESLDLAVNTLIDLQSSGRVVGIISHVSELKERMTSRIDVKSSLNGSEISVVSY